jgi:hypothetical protein
MVIFLLRIWAWLCSWFRSPALPPVLSPFLLEEVPFIPFEEPVAEVVPLVAEPEEAPPEKPTRVIITIGARAICRNNGTFATAHGTNHTLRM